MAELKYEPIVHDHEAFLNKAQKRKGFEKAYEDLKEEYTLVREMLRRVQSAALLRKTLPD
jgi:hypothetical protein